MNAVELTEQDRKVAQRLQIENNLNSIEKNKNEIFILKRKVELCMDKIMEMEGRIDELYKHR